MVAIDHGRLQSRADELAVKAKDAGVSDIDGAMALIPDENVFAKIAYLANALGIDVGLALDVDTPIEEVE